MTGLRELVEAVLKSHVRVAADLGSPRRTYMDGTVTDLGFALMELGQAVASTPDVLAAVEAVVALGEWRATEPQCEPDYAIRDRLDAIADRLAAREGE